MLDKKARVPTEKIGRNELCPCGSGKRYKHCHGSHADLADDEMPDPFWLRAEERRARIAVVCHLVRLDSAEKMLALLGNITEPFDLYVSLVRGRSEFQGSKIKQAHPRAHVVVFPSGGRDMLPFLWFVNSRVLFDYELVCKICDVAEGAGDQRVLAGVLGEGATERILARFRADRDCGIICAAEAIACADELDPALEHTCELASRVHCSIDPKSLRFTSGGTFWIRPFILRLLADIGLSYSDFQSLEGLSDTGMADAVEQLIGAFAAECGMQILDVQRAHDPIVRQGGSDPRIVAFYLAQYHPIPENDRWWGKGFTDWTNVAKAKPLFEGHDQPRVPGELGFYDLRMPETIVRQNQLAADYGIGAFCFHLCWFGRPVLDLPLRLRMSLSEVKFPFCVSWANENWTRSWDGKKSEILIPQTYESESMGGFARYVLECLRHPDYLRVDGRPILLVYNPLGIPDRIALIRAWREFWAKSGFQGVHLVAAITFDGEFPQDPRELGFDSYVQFPPHYVAQREYGKVLGLSPQFRGYIFDYERVLQVETDPENQKLLIDARLYRTVMLGWDNTARKGNGAHVFHGFNPGKFRRWLRGVMNDGGNRGLLFVNAWNEWAEGSYLEPDLRYGRAYLEAVASCVSSDRGIVQATGPAHATRID